MIKVLMEVTHKKFNESAHKIYFKTFAIQSNLSKSLIWNQWSVIIMKINKIRTLKFKN